MVIEQECLQLTADGPLCAQLGTLFAAGVAKGEDVEPQMVCAELMTGEGETDRRLWVRSCARELQDAEDRGLPRSALCFAEPLAAHQQAGG